MTTSAQVLAPLTDAAREEAARWLLRATPGTDLETDPEFVAWLERAPDHREAWRVVRRAWDDLDDPHDPLIDALRSEALRARGSRRASFWMPSAIAAGIVLAVAGGASWWLLSQRLAPLRPTIGADAPANLVAAKITTVRLPDGTLATLDAGAAAVLRFDEHRRAIRLLKGRIFLAIAADATRPFQLEAGGRRITDRGTAFETGIVDQDVAVTLVDGAVDVTGGERQVTLAPGQRLTTAGGRDHVETVSLQEAMGWRLRSIEFVDKPLGEALAEINRYGGAPARAMDPRLGRLKVSGVFTTGDPGRFAAIMAHVHGLRLAQRADGGVELLPPD